MLEALLSIGLVGWVDHVTLWELNFFPLYALPVILMTWHSGRSLGFVIAFLCAVTDWAADIGNNPFHTCWGYDLAALFNFFNLSIIVLAVTALKDRRRLDQLRIATLERMQAMEQQILQISEREQQRLGRDLHDGLGPQLAAIRYATTFLANELRHRGQQEAEKADQISQLIGDAGTLVRNLARGIFPVQMERDGLLSALKDFASTISLLTGVSVSCHEIGEISAKTPEDGMHFYRIAQEAVNNAIRHGEAQQITIVVSSIQNRLRLTIADNGKGMAAMPNGSTGIGLDSMRYRAHILGGELKIDSRPDEGTIVICEIPTRSP